MTSHLHVALLCGLSYPHWEAEQRCWLTFASHLVPSSWLWTISPAMDILLMDLKCETQDLISIYIHTTNHTFH